MTDHTRKAAKATWWSGIEVASRYGVQFVLMLVLARLLTPGDFGLVAMILVFTSIGTLLVDSGFGTALIQKQKTSDNDETTVFYFSLSVGLAAFALFWLGAPAVARFYAQPQLTELMRIGSLVLPIGALAGVPDALLTMRLDFRARSVAEVISSILAGLVAVVLAWRGFGAWSLVIQALVGMSLRALLLWRFSNWCPRGRFSTESFRGLSRFGGYILLANLLDTLALRLQSLLIGKLFDSRTLGEYTIAQNTQQAPTSFIGAILNRVGLPVFSSVADDPARLRGALRLSLNIAMFVFVPCMLGIALTARPLVILLFGERWAAAAPILRLLAIAAAWWPLHVLNLAALSALGRSDLFFRLEVLKKTVLVSLILIASPWGPVAIAGSVLGGGVFGIVVNTWYSKRLLGYGAVAQLYDQKGTFALSVAAGVAGWAIMHFSPPGAEAILVAVAIAALVYLGGAWITGNKALAELSKLLKLLTENPEDGGTDVRP